MTPLGRQDTLPGVERSRGIPLAPALVLVVLVAACSPFLSKGTLPPPGPNGQIDPSSAPDFLAVAGRDGGIAGYARTADVLGPGDTEFPVFGPDLRTVVGRMIPRRGFVPTGVDPASVPTFAVVTSPSAAPAGEANGQVVLYVRNDVAKQAWVTVEVGGQRWDSTGFWGQNTAVGCYAMPAGSRLVLLDRSPTELGASIVRAIYVRGSESEPPSLWLAIERDGSVQQGVGVPEWWGAPQSC